MKRTVCDRCHGQKLRCDRDDERFEDCKRCRKVGAVCTFPNYEGGNSRTMGDVGMRKVKSVSSCRDERMNESNGKSPANTRRISTQQVFGDSSASSDFMLSPTTSRKRPISELYDEQQNRSSHLDAEEMENTSKLATADDAFTLLASGIYDDGPYSISNLTSPQYGAELDFEQFSTTAVSDPQTIEQHLENAWPSSPRPERLCPVSISNTPSHGRRNSNHQQQQEWWSSNTRTRSNFTSTGMMIGREESEITSPSSPEHSALPTITPTRAARNIQCSGLSKSSTTYEANGTISTSKDNSARLFQLYTSLNNSSSPSTTASVADAFQHTMTLIGIIRSSVAPREAMPPPVGRTRDRNDSVTASTSQAHSSIGNADTLRNPVFSKYDLEPPERNENGKMPVSDPTIVFLVLACYFRIIELYQRLVLDLAEKLQNAGTQSTPTLDRSTSKSPGSTIDSPRCSSELGLGALAMEWVQTISSVVHLAEKINAAIALLPNSQPSTSDFHGRNNALHGLLSPSAAFTGGFDACLDEGGSELDKAVKGPMETLRKMRARLKESVKDVTEGIKEYDGLGL